VNELAGTVPSSSWSSTSQSMDIRRSNSIFDR
jgi:hypothetical protein